jgi:hypothetical protein
MIRLYYIFPNNQYMGPYIFTQIFCKFFYKNVPLEWKVLVVIGKQAPQIFERDSLWGSRKWKKLQY